MFEVQKLMLNGRGEVFVSIFGGIDPRVALLKVAFLIDADDSC